jgi:F0F1-type ATP synthase membrane subunit c/vacuolar-type H+-ATPase subunit K
VVAGLGRGAVAAAPAAVDARQPASQQQQHTLRPE